jgi:hypothetical protein
MKRKKGKQEEKKTLSGTQSEQWQKLYELMAKKLKRTK